MYNLQVADDRSFIANGIVVHNCIMAMAMGLWVFENSFKKLETLKKKTKAMLKGWVSSTKEDEEENNNNNNKRKRPSNPMKSSGGNNGQSEYMWLFSGMK